LNSSLAIRLATSDEYLKFHDICDNDLPHPLSIEGRLKQRRREFAQIEEGLRVAYFAEKEGQVVGSVQLRLRYKAPEEGLIHALIVQRQHRRTKIGTQLMDAVETEASRRSYRRIWLTVHSSNDAARHFYEKHRYTEVSTDISTDGERTIEMEKKI